jgi:hypothetical protein
MKTRPMFEEIKRLHLLILRNSLEFYVTWSSYAIRLDAIADREVIDDQDGYVLELASAIKIGEALLELSRDSQSSVGPLTGNGPEIRRLIGRLRVRHNAWKDLLRDSKIESDNMSIREARNN